MPMIRRRRFRRGLGFLSCAAMAVSAFAFPAAAQREDRLSQYVARCDSGDNMGCLDAGMVLSDVDDPAYDAFLSLRFLQQACADNAPAACGRLALVFFAGEGDVERNVASAGHFAARACSGHDRDGCEVAEAIFAEPGSPQFDAEKALRYRRVNCDGGNRQSCIDLARILYNMDDRLPAEQIALNACRPDDPASAEICVFGKRLQSLRHKVEAEQKAAVQAARDAQARQQAVFDHYITRRDYDGALYYALYHLRSRRHAETATLEASRAGVLSSIFEDHFHVLEYWFPSGPIAQTAARELAKKRRSSDCGIWNCTNMPGASARRWQAQRGSSGSSYASGVRASSFQPVRVPSSAEIAKQTRDRYRSYNCAGSRRLSGSHPVCQ